ncbi:MAG: hypothetical protein ACOX05_01810 [Bacillota bacterium]
MLMVWGKRFAQEGRKKALHFIKGRAGADSWEVEEEKSEDAGGERVGRTGGEKGWWLGEGRREGLSWEKAGVLGEGRRSLVVGWQGKVVEGVTDRGCGGER